MEAVYTSTREEGQVKAVFHNHSDGRRVLTEIRGKAPFGIEDLARNLEAVGQRLRYLDAINYHVFFDSIEEGYAFSTTVQKVLIDPTAKELSWGIEALKKAFPEEASIQGLEHNFLNEHEEEEDIGASNETG